MRTAHLTPNAVLLDRAFNDISTSLIVKLPWLHNAYGRAQRIHMKRDGRNYYLPSVRTKTNDYIDVSPCESLGNHSFVIVDDPEDVNTESGASSDISANFSVVFWFDTRKVDTYTLNGLDAVKAEILDVIKSSVGSVAAWRINRIYGTSANVYKEYNFDESVNQYMTAPFMALRFTGTIKAQQNC